MTDLLDHHSPLSHADVKDRTFENRYKPPTLRSEAEARRSDREEATSAGAPVRSHIASCDEAAPGCDRDGR